MWLPAGHRVGSYEIVAALGEGGMGQVYRARDLKLGRDVALKVLPDHLSADVSRRERFQHEARVLATVNHPNVAVIYGIEDAGGRVALAMELVHGAPLSERIGPRGLPLEVALKIATQVAAGLEAAHRAGIVHRDLKPGNVLVTPAGVVKLVDFGIAKVLASESPFDEPAVTRSVAPAPQTEQGQILGTVSYMSPEQARGESVDARSDLFSFGTLLYEMLTGHRPFAAGDQVSTLAAILHKEPPPPVVSNGPPLPRELERIILRCLRKDRERRFQTASDLKLELEDLEEDTATSAPVQAPAPASTIRRPRARYAAAGLMAVAIAAAGALYFLPRTTPTGSRASALRQLTFEAGLAITPAVSPDGRLLAYASDRSGEGQLDIWLKQVAGGEPVRLTHGPDSKVNPQFSPDGTRVYFLGGRSDISEVPALGGTSRMLVEAAGPFTVSSRGDLAFYRPGTGTAPGPIFVSRAGTPTVEPWHPECVSSGPPIWSPDGTRIAFAGVCSLTPVFGTRVGEILTAPLAGGAIQRVGTVNVPFVAPRLAWASLAGGTEVLLIPQRSGDSMNLVRLAFDGTSTVVTQGTGFENWPAVSSSGDVIFMRTDQTPSVWSLPLRGDGQAPVKEASPARLFGTSPDGRKLVFGRMLGTEQGQLILRDRERGIESVLASHHVGLEGSGSFWPQVSPDGQRVVYRVNLETTVQYVVSTSGGTPRRLAASSSFFLASDWSPDGGRVIGECLLIERGICELLPDRDTTRPLLTDAGGGQLLYPSFAWDGAWVTFMHRRDGRTRVVATPVGADGTLAGRELWVSISPDDADGGRPRFSPDGAALFYLLATGNVVTLVRQQLDAASKRPIGTPVKLMSVQNIPQSVFNIGVQNVITVTRERLFYNTAEVRGNVWMTRIE